MFSHANGGLLLLLLLGCSAEVTTSSEEVAALASPIFGGQADFEHEAVVSLRHAGRCSGTVVHADVEQAVVLTAGHCVVELDDEGDVRFPITPVSAKELVVTTGQDVTQGLWSGSEFTADEIIVAPGFNGFLGNPDDVAVVRVFGDFSKLPTIPLLSPAEDDLAVGASILLVGFGDTEAGDNTERRVTEQHIAQASETLLHFDQSNGHGVCNGDSGGPALAPSASSGELAVAGVSSFVAANGAAEPCRDRATSIRASHVYGFVTDAIAGRLTTPVSGTDTGRASPARSEPEGGCSLSGYAGKTERFAAWWTLALLSMLVLVRRARTKGRATRIVKLALAGALLCSCDPEGPGASGLISLAPKLDAKTFSSLELRAYPDASSSFDAAKVPADAPARLSLITSEVTFPYQYDIGEGVGTSEQQRWRLVAWLSRGAGTPVGPEPGDPFCTAAFELESCGTFGDYCAVSHGIDCTIE